MVSAAQPIKQWVAVRPNQVPRTDTASSPLEGAKQW
jgi:hypothetical protein